MTPIDAVTTCLTKYADFTGRASRPEYWWFWLFSGVVGLVAIGSPALAAVALVALLLPGLAALVRRLHDTGRPGTYLFIALIPLLGTIILLVWLATAGDAQVNMYGPPQAAPDF